MMTNEEIQMNFDRMEATNDAEQNMDETINNPNATLTEMHRAIDNFFSTW